MKNEIRACWRDRESASHREWHRRPDSLVPPQGMRHRPVAKNEGHCNDPIAKRSVAGCEPHWYESPGIGKRDLKIKRYVSEA
jgi:hypothetical protein